jgi:putative DNA primase/helicase
VYLNNDHGNSERLIACQSGGLLYCSQMAKWLVWDDRRWQVDVSDQARHLCKLTMLEFLSQAICRSNGAAEKFAHGSLNTRLLSNALRESQGRLSVLTDELDQEPFALNFLNGTVDLRNGGLRAHCREDRITKLVHHRFNPDAACPRFIQFLEEVTGGGPDVGQEEAECSARLMDYLQLAFGYSLTGVTNEKAVFLLYGPHDNGKSTLLATFLKLLDEYAVLLQIDSLMMKAAGENNNTQADLADLRGARFVMTSETEEGQRLAEGKLKRITQGIGRIKAVRKYENPIEFQESHKLWIDANHLPVIRSHDDATWRRLHAIPFMVTIPREKQDRGLADKLLAEAEGILAWAVAGAVRWYAGGLSRPSEVEQTKASWRKDLDQVGRFLEERCIRGAGQVQAEQLFKAYCVWAEAAGERAMKGRAFAERLKEAGFEKYRDRYYTWYVGIVLRSLESEQRDGSMHGAAASSSDLLR